MDTGRRRPEVSILVHAACFIVLWTASECRKVGRSHSGRHSAITHSIYDIEIAIGVVLLLSLSSLAKTDREEENATCWQKN